MSDADDRRPHGIGADPHTSDEDLRGVWADAKIQSVVGDAYAVDVTGVRDGFGDGAEPAPPDDVAVPDGACFVVRGPDPDAAETGEPWIGG
jgi:hypothetical protein